MKYIEFPSPFGVIFSLIMHPLVHTSGTLVSVSFRSYILSYAPFGVNRSILNAVFVSVSFRSYILSYWKI